MADKTLGVKVSEELHDKVKIYKKHNRYLGYVYSLIHPHVYLILRHNLQVMIALVKGYIKRRGHQHFDRCVDGFY